MGMLTGAMGRLLGFGACLIGAAVCFFVAFITLPWIALRPAKFALAFRYEHLPPLRSSQHHAANIHSYTQLGEPASYVRVRPCR